MALLNILLIVGVITLPLVENAPRKIVNTPSPQEDLGSKVVFVDRDAEDFNYQSKPPSAFQSPKPYEARSVSFTKAVQIPQTLNVKSAEPSILSEMDDERRIWGIAVDNKEIDEDESYYNRPIILPTNVVKFTAPAKKVIVNEVKKVEPSVNVPEPSACDFSIVICCGSRSNLKECFKSQGCSNATEDMFPYLCSAESISRIIQELGTYYKGQKQ